MRWLLLSLASVLLAASATGSPAEAEAADARGDERVLLASAAGSPEILAPVECEDPSVDLLKVRVSADGTRGKATLTIADFLGEAECGGVRAAGDEAIYSVRFSTEGGEAWSAAAKASTGGSEPCFVIRVGDLPSECIDDVGFGRGPDTLSWTFPLAGVAIPACGLATPTPFDLRGVAYDVASRAERAFPTTFGLWDDLFTCTLPRDPGPLRVVDDSPVLRVAL